MTELKNEHFEVIDKNKQKAHEDRQKMRTELIKYINNCDAYELSMIYNEYKRLKKNR